MAPKSIERILVAVKDPTSMPSPSVVKAAQLARALNAELVLFHGIDVPLYAETYSGANRTMGDDEESIRKHFLHNLTSQAAQVRQDGLAVSVAAEWDYPAHEAVLRHACRINADLIVTERHSHASEVPWALHSTDWELLRLSPKPVLMVKNGSPYRHSVVMAALDPAHRHGKSAELDQEICALAQLISGALGGRWHALHAAGGPLSGVPAPVVDSQLARARTAFDRLLQSVSLQPKSALLLAQMPAEAIVEGSRDLHAALLVMGTLSRSGLKRLLIGNTAEQVIDRVGCDVLVVKPRGFKIHFSRNVRGAHVLAVATERPLR